MKSDNTGGDARPGKEKQWQATRTTWVEDNSEVTPTKDTGAAPHATAGRKRVAGTRAHVCALTFQIARGDWATRTAARAAARWRL